MKNINVKKVVAGAAALALGVGVLGAAIASNVGGSAFGPVSKSDLLNNGAAVPTIVVGANAAATDMTWATNIATAIANKAATRGPDTVVEGTGGTSTMDDGLLTDDIVIEVDETVGMTTIELDDGDYEKLHDEDLEGEYDDDDLDINEKETLTVDGIIGFQTDKDAESLMLSIATEDINYTADFSEDSGIPIDFATSDDLSIYFMGQMYDVQKVDSDGAKITLVGTGGVQAYETGDSINVTGTDGEDYTLTVGNVYSDESVRVLLMQGSTQLAAEMFDEEDTIEFNDYTLADSVSVVAVYDDTSTVNQDVVELSVGSGGLLELEHGEALPGYENADEDKLWTVDIINDGNYITSISVYNDELVWDNQDLTEEDDLSLVPGDEIELPLNFGTVKFLEDLTEETLGELSVGNGVVTWEDRKLREHTVDIFYEDLQEETITIDELNDYYFITDGTDVTVTEDDEDGTLVGTYATGDTVTLVAKNDIDVNYMITIYDTDKIALTLDSTGVEFADGLATWAMADAEGVIYDPAGPEEAYIDEEAVAYATLTITEDVDVDTVFNIDVASGDLVDTALDDDDVDDYNFWSAPAGQAVYDAAGENITLNSEDAEDDLGAMYTEFGSHIEVTTDVGTYIAPEGIRYLQVSVGGLVTTGGTEDQVIPGEVIPATWTPSSIVKTDAQSPGGTKIIVGGHMINSYAVGITESHLTQSEQWVVGKYIAGGNGNIVVAGYTAADTVTAAQEFIATINAMPQ